jgi:hypothetical protein
MVLFLVFYVHSFILFQCQTLRLCAIVFITISYGILQPTAGDGVVHSLPLGCKISNPAFEPSGAKLMKKFHSRCQRYETGVHVWPINLDDSMLPAQ